MTGNIARQHAAATEATMAVDIFLDIENIKGESKDHKYKESIDVLSWSWGMSQSGSAHMGGGAGAGKVQVQDLNFTHYIDKSSRWKISWSAMCRPAVRTARTG
jgi:hypothetical protein